MLSKLSRKSARARWMRGTAAALLFLPGQAYSSTIDAPTPKDSYLIHQVSSVKELVAEVKDHPVIQQRYSRLYHVSPSKLERYMTDNLVLTTLTHNYTHPVYCVTPSGVVFTIMQTQQTSAKVFALRSGKPVLRWECGNPFTATLPPPISMAAFNGITVVHHKRHIGKPGALLVASIGAADIPEQPADLPYMVVEKVSSYVGGMPTVASVINVVGPAASGASKLVPILPFGAVVPLLGGLAAGGSGSGDSGDSSGEGGGSGGDITTSITNSGAASPDLGTVEGDGGTASTGGGGGGADILESSTSSTGGSTTTTGGSSTAGSSTSTDGGTTTTSGSTSDGSTTDGSTTIGTSTTGSPTSTPEPNSMTFWSIAGTILAIMAARPRRKQQTA